MTYFLQLTINAIALGSIYALTAVGYSMVYGILELVNFAHGSVFMLGAFSYYIFAVLVGLPWYLSFLITFILIGIVGFAYDRLTLLPLRRTNQPKFTGLICTLGVSIVLQNLVFVFMGSNTRQFPTFFEGRYLSLGPFNISFIQILIVCLSVAIMVALSLFVKKAKLGVAMRAVAQNSMASEWMGINVNGVVSLTFIIGSVLAALSGILSCMSFRSLDITIGSTIAIKAFTATVLGGIGNLGGAVLGAFIVAMAESYTAGFISSDMRDLSAFVILMLVLLFRPNGLLGKAVQKKV